MIFWHEQRHWRMGEYKWDNEDRKQALERKEERKQGRKEGRKK